MTIRYSAETAAFTDAPLKIILQLDPSVPGEADDIERLCQTLRSAGASDVHRPVLAPPERGWRGGDGQVPDVVATITGSAPVLGQVIAALRRCLAALGNPRRSIEMSINGNTVKVTGLSRENEDRLIAVFIDQVCGKS